MKKDIVVIHCKGMLELLNSNKVDIGKMIYDLGIPNEYVCAMSTDYSVGMERDCYDSICAYLKLDLSSCIIGSNLNTFNIFNDLLSNSYSCCECDVEDGIDFIGNNPYTPNDSIELINSLRNEVTKLKNENRKLININSMLTNNLNNLKTEFDNIRDEYYNLVMKYNNKFKELNSIKERVRILLSSIV